MRVFESSGRVAPLVAAAMLAGTVSASAAIVDFTASASSSGSVGGVSWTLTPSPGDNLNFVDTDAPGPIGPLAGNNDGVGLNAFDEIRLGDEFVTVTFSKKVRLVTYFTLDLFEDGVVTTDAESAILYAGNAPLPGSLLAELPATEIFVPGGFGFDQLAVSFIGDTFTFAAGSGNDNVGKADFALAGLEIAAIPLPASGLMIGSLMALGLGFMGRRRR